MPTEGLFYTSNNYKCYGQNDKVIYHAYDSGFDTTILERVVDPQRPGNFLTRGNGGVIKTCSPSLTPKFPDGSLTKEFFKSTDAQEWSTCDDCAGLLTAKYASVNIKQAIKNVTGPLNAIRLSF